MNTAGCSHDNPLHIALRAFSLPPFIRREQGGGESQRRHEMARCSASHDELLDHRAARQFVLESLQWGRGLFSRGNFGDFLKITQQHPTSMGPRMFPLHRL